jgi:magnesium transporter
MTDGGTNETQLAIELLRRIDGADGAGLAQFLDGVPPGDLVRLIARLDGAARTRLFQALAPSRAASLLETLPKTHAEAVLERLDVAHAVAILVELSRARQADLLGGLAAETSERILGAMPAENARVVRELSGYAHDVAGGLMVTEYLAYPSEATVQHVVDDMARHAERYRDYIVQYSYVTDSSGRLVGVLRLRDLLLSRRDQPLHALMLPDPVRVRDTATLDELRDLFDKHRYFGVPVVDGDGRLIGLVRQARVEAALAERADADYLKAVGIVGGEELRSLPMLVRSRRRLAWLSVNVLLNVVAASVISFYQETLAAVIALAVFLPIISDMSGCSGNQAVAVSMRELALGLVRPRDIGGVLFKEVVVGLLNGVALGALIAVVATLWKGSPWLGFVVGVALALNTVVAVVVGGALPLVFRGLGVDPALASGPVLTTITDMCGFFLVLALATALLPRLVGG